MDGPRTILIVEDDRDLRRMFRTALAFAGFRVLEAGDGLHALHVLDRDPPALVVLDLGLPLVSGRIVRQEIAGQAHMRHIRVVVVTGEPGTHDDLDVEYLLQKPVSPEILVRTVRSCLDAAAATPI